ncbi:hypothetical protein PMG71_15715 [Roseofilum sp. BLCC_M154]|uniref:DUF6972 domain-containing protein n=1 Tax=Roseofilum acuticapitatum BLCC-M154 TaxID=3022444 RepID=A0ABT7AVD9_9CYAN|nr:hypothetical protein [Roseofilum acuticapitatum]MDJ1170881.1 hypothetical protein [Roseofilum acuticapitatum BLCC-M154]
MSGIEREIKLESRTSLIDKHLPGTDKSQRELQKEGIVYLFNDRDTLERVASEILNHGEQTGADDEHDPYERYGLFFAEPIGYILKLDGTRIPLYYGEVKIKKSTGQYHVIPRTKPRTTNC